jgi:N-acetylmuramoyl-L-alanine amidase
VIYLLLGCAGHYKNTRGKETPYIPSLKRRIKEWEFNEPVWQMLMEEMKKSGVHVVDCAPGERDVPLKERTDYANKMYWQYCAKYGRDNVKAVYISEHYDAFDGTFEGHNPSGFTVFVYKGQLNKESGKLAKLLVEELSRGTKQVCRGVKEADLAVVRDTVMPAALIENGFMDNPEEALLMLNQDFQREVVKEQANALRRYFGIKVKVSDKKEEIDMLDKAIVIGGFPDFAVAEILAARLKAPVYTRAALPAGKIAKEVYVVGGSVEGIQGDKVISLSGVDRFAVAATVKKFLG